MATVHVHVLTLYRAWKVDWIMKITKKDTDHLAILVIGTASLLDNPGCEINKKTAINDLIFPVSKIISEALAQEFYSVIDCGPCSLNFASFFVKNLFARVHKHTPYYEI